jgi:hypothetical protein
MNGRWVLQSPNSYTDVHSNKVQSHSAGLANSAAPIQGNNLVSDMLAVREEKQNAPGWGL